jgi:hypothetical protein
MGVQLFVTMEDVLVNVADITHKYIGRVGKLTQDKGSLVSDSERCDVSVRSATGVDVT